MRSKSGAVRRSLTPPSRLLSTLRFCSSPLHIQTGLGWGHSVCSSSVCSWLVPRADIFLLEVCFAAADAQQDFIANPFVCKHFTAHPLPPAGTPPTFILIKLVNVPVLSLTALEQAIRSFWSSPGEVVALAPHRYKDTPFISNHWDLVLKLSGGKTLSVTPFFDLCGFKVMTSWNFAF